MNLSDGVRLYLTLDDIEMDWINLCQSLSYWQDFVSMNEKGSQEVTEALDLITEIKGDMKTFKDDLTKYYPQAFEQLETQTAEPLI